LPVLLLLSAFCSGEEVVLEYKGMPGQVFAYEFTCATDAEATVGGKTEPVASQGTLTVVETIVAVTAQDHLKLRFAFPSGSLSSSLNRHVVSIPLSFPSVEMTMTRSGNPLTVRLVAAKSAAGDSPQAPPSPVPTTSFADLFAHLRCLSFPSTAVAPGDSWSMSGALPRPGGKSLQVTGTSRLTGVEEHGGSRCAVIHSQVTIPLESTQTMLGLTAEVTGRSVVTSTTYFDISAGRVRELLGTEHAQRTIRLRPAPKSTSGKDSHAPSATMQVDSTTTFAMRLQKSPP